MDELNQRVADIPDAVTLLTGLFAHAPIGFIIYTADGRCLTTNAAFRAMFGSQPPPEYNLFKDEVAAAQGVAALITRAFSGETLSTPPIWYDPRDLKHVRVREGQRVAFTATFFPLQSAGGAVSHVAIAIKDVTAEQLAQQQAEARQREAEAAETRARFLSEVSAALSHSLDYAGTLQQVAHLAVPRIADWCTVTVLDEQGRFRRVAVVHRDPQRAPLAEEYLAHFPPGDHRAGELSSVLKSGTPVFRPEISDRDLEQSAQSPTHLRLLKGLGCTSCIMVPMLSGGRPMGVLSLMRCEPGHPFSEADFLVAQELAYRAGVCVENAHRFALLQAAEAQSRQQAERLRLLSEASRLFANAPADLPNTLKAIAQLLANGLGDSCSLRLLSPDRSAFVLNAFHHRDPALNAQMTALLGAAVQQPTEGIAGRTLKTRQTVFLPEVDPQALASSFESAPHAQLVTTHRVRSIICAPLFIGADVAGVLGVTRFGDNPPYTAHDRMLVEDLADRASLALRTTSVLADLTRSERRLRGVFESRMVGIGYFNPRGEIEDANAVLLDLIGYSHQDVEERHLRWREITPPELHALDSAALQEISQSGFCRPFEKAYLRKDGTRVPVMVGGAALNDERTAGVYFAIDISERRALEQEREALLERSRFLAEAGTVLGSSLEHDEILERITTLLVPRLADWCSVELLQDGALEQLAVAHRDPAMVVRARELRREYPPDLAAPSGIGNVIRTGKPELYKSLTPALLERTARNEEHRALLMQLAMRSAMIVPLATGRTVLGALTLISTEGSPQYTEDDLAFVVELARRASLAVENARLYSELRASVRVRDDFLSIAGHELRTPLSALLMQIQGVQKLARAETLSPRLVDRLEKAGRSTLRLKALVNQLLDVSRITAGKLVLDAHPLNLTELVEEVVGQFRESAAPDQAPFTTSLEPGVTGVWDALRLEQVITNLLSNAVKYGRGQPVEVRLWREGGQARLSVKDHGIGIPPEEQARLFSRFERAVQSREYGGIGLGLWISRQAVEASGGTIQLRSTPGEGAEFTVLLPLERSVLAPAPAG